MLTDRWLTYTDAAKLLRMTPESVRQRARREHWGKKLNNEGKAIILVPLQVAEDAAASPPDDTAGDTGAGQGVDMAGHRPVKRPEADPVLLVQDRIKDLQAQAAEMRAAIEHAHAERDRERDERILERERAERIATELTELAKRFTDAAEQGRAREQQLQNRIDEGGGREAALQARIAQGQGREAELQARIDAVQARMAELRTRPWWRRLMAA